MAFITVLQTISIMKITLDVIKVLIDTENINSTTLGNDKRIIYRQSSGEHCLTRLEPLQRRLQWPLNIPDLTHKFHRLCSFVDAILNSQLNEIPCRPPELQQNSVC